MGIDVVKMSIQRRFHQTVIRFTILLCPLHTFKINFSNQPFDKQKTNQQGLHLVAIILGSSNRDLKFSLEKIYSLRKVNLI